MSAYPISDEHYPPVYVKRFTSYAGGVVLHADSANGGSAPTDVNHLPCQLIIEIGTADQHLDVVDVAGTTSAINFDAVGTYVLRLAPVSLAASTTAAAVTVCWNQKG